MLAIENGNLPVGVVPLRNQLPDDLDDALRFLCLRCEGIVEDVASYAFVGFQRMPILAFGIFRDDFFSGAQYFLAASVVFV